MHGTMVVVEIVIKSKFFFWNFEKTRYLDLYSSKGPLNVWGHGPLGPLHLSLLKHLKFSQYTIFDI